MFPGKSLHPVSHRTNADVSPTLAQDFVYGKLENLFDRSLASTCNPETCCGFLRGMRLAQPCGVGTGRGPASSSSQRTEAGLQVVEKGLKVQQASVTD